MTGYIDWLVLGFGAAFLMGALLILLVVVVFKMRGRRAGPVSTANPFLRMSLRQRMDAEDKQEAEAILGALYTARSYTERQAEREAKMRQIVAGLVPAGAPPVPNP